MGPYGVGLHHSRTSQRQIGCHFIPTTTPSPPWKHPLPHRDFVWESQDAILFDVEPRPEGDRHGSLIELCVFIEPLVELSLQGAVNVSAVEWDETVYFTCCYVEGKGDVILIWIISGDSFLQGRNALA